MHMHQTTEKKKYIKTKMERTGRMDVHTHKCESLNIPLNNCLEQLERKATEIERTQQHHQPAGSNQHGSRKYTHFQVPTECIPRKNRKIRSFFFFFFVSLMHEDRRQEDDSIISSRKESSHRRNFLFSFPFLCPPSPSAT